MNSENGLDVLKEGIARMQSLQVRGDQACLPVVAVDDVGLPSEPLQSLDHSVTKENESLVIVLVVLLAHRALVNPVPSEVFLIVQKIDLDLVLEVANEGGFDVSQLNGIADRDRDILEPDDVMQLELALADEPIARHHDSDFVA